MTDTAQAMLAALTDGLPPHADPLDCDDMRGPRSFFGESSRMPRPVDDLAFCCAALQGNKNLRALYGGFASLWHPEREESLAENARRICGAGLQFRLPERESDAPRGPELDVPARTYLVGRATSSFAVAWKLYEDGMLPEWGAVLCSCQTEGRGRLRRPWHSPRGNLYVSFRLPANPIFSGDAAPLFTGLLLLRAFRKLGFTLHLKWPNDLLLDERCKAGGILLEEKNGVLMAGLGLNLVEAPEAERLRREAAIPACLLLPHGETVPGGGGHYEPLPPFPLWRRLVSEAIIEYDERLKHREPSALLPEVNALLAWKERPVLLREEGEPPVHGVFLGLGPSGGALLRLSGGEREFFSGSLGLQ